MIYHYHLCLGQYLSQSDINSKNVNSFSRYRRPKKKKLYSLFRKRNQQFLFVPITIHPYILNHTEHTIYHIIYNHYK